MLQQVVVAHSVRNLLASSLILLLKGHVQADLGATSLHQFQKRLLPPPQVVNQESKVRIHFVEFAKLLVHLVGLLFELYDFSFSGLDISLEVLYFVVEHKLELL